MPRIGVEARRRKQLIEATLASIHAEGFGRVSLARIASRAGLSPGLVAHYFDDKAGLMEATMRHLAAGLGRELRRRLARAGSPRDRLIAVIEANFAETYYRPETIQAWLAFWAQVNQTPTLARIQSAISKRLESNLRAPLRDLVPSGEVEPIARALSVMIDGLWLRSAMTGGGLARQDALQIARRYLDMLLGAAGRNVSEDGADA